MAAINTKKLLNSRTFYQLSHHEQEILVLRAVLQHSEGDLYHAAQMLGMNADELSQKLNINDSEMMS